MKKSKKITNLNYSRVVIKFTNKIIYSMKVRQSNNKLSLLQAMLRITKSSCKTNLLKYISFYGIKMSMNSTSPVI